jgi:membrane-bound lytic murein transglycosylase A
MRSRIPGILFLFILLCIGIAAWFSLPHKATKTPTLALTSVSLTELPGWSAFDKRPALSAFRRSCVAILKLQAAAELGGYAGRAGDWFGVCRAALSVEESAARRFFESRFSAFEVGGEALITGYYEPLLHGSRRRHGVYQTPVYAQPRDLVSVDLGTFRPEWKGERIAGTLSDQHLVPYATRAEIDEFPPPASILFYGDDPVAVFFLHVQGSGRVALDDGATIRVAYAAQNGRPYSAIGTRLIHLGVLTRETVSMQAIRAWLRANPSAARQVMETNQSYVFFKEEPVGDASLGSVGTEGVSLTPGASIAIDPKFHALGVPIFIATQTADGQKLANLFVAQDTGGAIRGPARADIFFGFGQSAEELAGRMKAAGHIYVLLPNQLASGVTR